MSDQKPIEQDEECAKYTSQEAHAQIQDSAPALRERIFRFVKECGDQGSTCDEAEVVLGMRHQTASARFTELQKKNRVKVVGTRKTRTGRPARVFVVNG